MSIIHDGLGLLLDLRRPLVYLPCGFRRSLVQAISGLGSLFPGSQMSSDMLLPSGSRSRYLSPGTKKFFWKSVFHTMATPLMDQNQILPRFRGRDMKQFLNFTLPPTGGFTTAAYLSGPAPADAR